MNKPRFTANQARALWNARAFGHITAEEASKKMDRQTRYVIVDSDTKEFYSGWVPFNDTTWIARFGFTAVVMTDIRQVNTVRDAIFVNSPTRNLTIITFEV